MKYTVDLYDAGFKDGKNFAFNEIVDMTLRCTMISLYKNGFGADDIKIMRDDITDAVSYYASHPKEMEELLDEIDQELGFKTGFQGKGKRRDA